MRKFELVLPAYNESKNLEILIQRSVQAATEMGIGAEEFGLVIVQNGSKDNSEQVLTELKSGPLGKWFRHVSVSTNKGYGFGIMQGLKVTEAEIIGWSHADMQCDPKNALLAYRELSAQQEAKVLIKGTRTGRNWKDWLVSRVFELIASIIFGRAFHEINAQPKVFNRRLLSLMKEPPLTFAFDIYCLYAAKKDNYTIRTIPVTFPPRIHGFSNWSATFFRRYATILGMIRYMAQLAKREGRL